MNPQHFPLFVLLLLVATITTPLSRSTDAGFKSPFPSDVPGLSIGNASPVNSSGRIIRGSQPDNAGLIAELARLGITDVVILKDSPENQITAEVEALKKQGLRPDQISLLPFQWQHPEAFQSACRKTVRALQVLSFVQRTPNRKAYFHCTAGEDRTGMIAGLYRQLSQGWSTSQAFQTEMCPNGYEAGNPHKPPAIVQSIRASLTPLYLKMSRLIETRALNPDRLDERVCGQDPLPQIPRIPTCGSAPGN